tara:strand:- start:290 stop:556 length:267 start_codon:yes stop_codon:yes gene_type:complete
MKCEKCQKEDPWLEMIGANFICSKCINKHPILGKVMRTHIDTFRFLLRKIKPESYVAFMAISREDIEKHISLKKIGIKLKTTNVVELD